MRRIRQMMRILYLAALWLCVLFNTALAEFDLTQFEFEGEFEGLFLVTHEEDAVFIDADLPVKERSFSHKYDSQNYYSAVNTDLIVINPKESDEYVVPRIWIYYRTEEEQLNVKTVEFVIGKEIYAYSPDKTDISELKHGTVEESILIKLGRSSLGTMNAWYQAFERDEPIMVRLIGEKDRVEFEFPEIVMDSSAVLWALYAEAGGLESADQILETPVSVSSAAEPKRKTGSGVLQYHDKENNTAFDIPAGWSLADSEDDESTAVKFEWKAEGSNEGANIVYVSTDLWTELWAKDAELMQGMNRSSIDQVFTAADIAQMYNIDAENVEIVTVGGYEYYKANVLMIEKPFSYANVVYLNTVNGYTYLFEYTGSAQRLDDFEQMIESVEHFRSM